MKSALWIPVTVVVLLAVGCGASAAPVEDSSVLSENPQVDPQAQRIDELKARATPDVEGTVEARVQATLAAIPTSTPDLTLERMKRAAMAEVLLKEKVVIANLLQSVRPINWEFRKLYDRFSELYVPIYMASACLEGDEPSVGAFREYAPTWFAQEARPDPIARMMIQEIHEQISSVVQSEKLCLQPALVQCRLPYRARST